MSTVFNDADVAQVQSIKDSIDALANKLENIASKYEGGEDKEDAMIAVELLRRVDKPLRSFT